MTLSGLFLGCRVTPAGRYTPSLAARGHHRSNATISRHAIVWTAALLIPAVASSPAADVIDFETTPAGATPTDNTNLNAPYNIDGGGTVTFFFDLNGNNVFDAGIDKAGKFEKAGDADVELGFVGSVADDTADPGFEAQLGDWFLRHPDFGENVPGPLIVDYDTQQVITALSGEIWDIDGLQNPERTEQWRADVLADGAGGVLATKTSPVGTLPSNIAPLDGRPGFFFFDNLPTGVDKLRLTFIGTKTENIGLAFNNFRPRVPEPTILLMLGAGSVVILGSRRSNRRY